MKLTDLTPASAALFLRHAIDAANWSGCPLLDITKEERGNLTDLKVKKLVTTEVSDGCEFLIFTELGRELVKTELGIEIENN